jgi:hypothetical protein
MKIFLFLNIIIANNAVIKIGNLKTGSPSNEKYSAPPTAIKKGANKYKFLY